MGRVTITEAGERYIGLSFLEGRSIGDLATEQCCSTRTIEAVIRAQMRHLIDVKRPILQSTPASDLTSEAEQPHTEPAA